MAITELVDGDNNVTPVGKRLSFAENARGWIQNLKSGEIGSLPVVLGLVLIAVFFQAQNDRYLSAQNLTNLLVQMAAIATISTGIVFVLLIGEIDLSVGAMAGVGGVIIARLIVPDGTAEVPWYVALGLALLVGIVVGGIHGWFVAKIGVPSLIVTLATLFIGRGVVLAGTGKQGLIRVQDDSVIGIANTFLQPSVAWTIAIGAISIYAVTNYLSDRNAMSQGLSAQSWSMYVARTSLAAVMVLGVVAVTGNDRGLPLITVLLGAAVVILTVFAERTHFGRYIYAVGGNAEASRRAGINVDRIKIACFMIGSFMAVLGGLVLASRLRSVDNSAGEGNLLLNSIAGAVIGGTSLFGGRGKISSAIQGALVIASVESGMGLLGWPSDRKFMVTGAILLIAVTVDTVSRRTRQSSGRA